MKQTIDHRCASRRDALALLGAGSLLIAGATPAFASKMAQAAVGYQATPKGDRQCSNCNFFVSPSSCKVVDGTVGADAWCKLWAKKAG
jgi:hypothetical protein